MTERRVKGDEVRELIARAREDNKALGELLERYRPYVSAIARDELDSRLNRRIDESDIVQESYLEAHRDFPQFKGNEEAEWITWLRRVVLNNIIEQARHHKAIQKRSLDREQSQSPSGRHRLDSAVAPDSSVGTKMVRVEQHDIVFQYMQALPVSQREAVRLHYLDGWTIRQIADYLDRTEVGVAGLIRRGVRKLRQSLVGRDHI